MSFGNYVLPFHIFYLHALNIGVHGKKSPCYECHVEVHGAGEQIFSQKWLLLMDCLLISSFRNKKCYEFRLKFKASGF